MYGFNVLYDSVYCCVFGVGVKIYCVVVVFYVSFTFCSFVMWVVVDSAGDVQGGVFLSALRGALF